jgi:magnesium-transporting ATPase (P-type)
VAFSPIQIILTELFTDLGASASFVAEPLEAGLMTGRPRDPRSRFMDRSMLTSITAAPLGLSVAVIASYVLAIIAFVPLAVLLPSAHGLFKTVALNGWQWLLVLVLAGTGPMWIEAWKLLRSGRHDTSSRVASRTDS